MIKGWTVLLISFVLLGYGVAVWRLITTVCGGTSERFCDSREVDVVLLVILLLLSGVGVYLLVFSVPVRKTEEQQADVTEREPLVVSMKVPEPDPVVVVVTAPAPTVPVAAAPAAAAAAVTKTNPWLTNFTTFLSRPAILKKKTKLHPPPPLV